MHRQELQALVQILNRTPLSQAESMWVSELIQREQRRIAERQSEEAAAGAAEGV